jgi:hypothetical protein
LLDDLCYIPSRICRLRSRRRRRRDPAQGSAAPAARRDFRQALSRMSLQSVRRVVRAPQRRRARCGRVWPGRAR